METAELNARVLDDARRYDPANHRQTLLAPHREALVLYRAKGMSYERIAAALRKQGLNVAPPTVGAFCRRQITEAEVLRERRRLEASLRRPAADFPAAVTPLAPPSAKSSPAPAPGRRGPKIARDDF